MAILVFTTVLCILMVCESTTITAREGTIVNVMDKYIDLNHSVVYNPAQAHGLLNFSRFKRSLQRTKIRFHFEISEQGEGYQRKEGLCKSCIPPGDATVLSLSLFFVFGFREPHTYQPKKGRPRDTERERQTKPKRLTKNTRKFKEQKV
jgi:hypothetical protein